MVDLALDGNLSPEYLIRMNVKQTLVPILIPVLLLHELPP